MRIRHIIVEGPDGAGKTTLVKHLTEKGGYTAAPKASTPRGGPVSNLASWAEVEEAHMLARSHSLVYDRHPVISEPIYGRVVREKPAKGYDTWSWLVTRRLFLFEHSLVVWCLPPLEVVRANVSSDRDLAGVSENINQLYNAYRIMANAWTGLALRIDPFRGLTDVASHIDLLMGGQRVLNRG